MMGNYEYIIASLPALKPGWKFSEGTSFSGFVDWIKTQLSEADIRTLDTLLQGYDPEKLDEGFYKAALKDGNRFIREFFTFDLNARNALFKVISFQIV